MFFVELSFSVAAIDEEDDDEDEEEDEEEDVLLLSTSVAESKLLVLALVAVSRAFANDADAAVVVFFLLRFLFILIAFPISLFVKVVKRCFIISLGCVINIDSALVTSFIDNTKHDITLRRFSDHNKFARSADINKLIFLELM